MFRSGRFLLMTALTAALLAGCRSRVAVPEGAAPIASRPRIFPDYDGVTFPVNIAPMNFRIDEQGERFVTVLRAGDRQEMIAGRIVAIGEKAWRELLGSGGTLSITVYRESSSGWERWEEIVNEISPDPIDPWLAYRLIEPGYQKYDRIVIDQRSMESFDERVIIDNNSIKNGCVNCHHFRNRSGDDFLFHCRQQFGGMVRVHAPAPDGASETGRKTVERFDTRNNPHKKAAVYPAWHPSLPLIAFTTNTTPQVFHTLSPNRIEVYDQASELILYNEASNQMVQLTETDDILETFPSWSPDGEYLYYCSAALGEDYWQKDPQGREVLDERGEKKIAPEALKRIRYNISRMRFHPESASFDPPEVVVDAPAEEKSAIHPRVSPDGRFLLYTISAYGSFPIWHRDAELEMLDLAGGEKIPTEAINSPESESWHTWDSSGRWLVFASRRDDTLYTRLYFAHIDSDGRFAKPFMLPQKDPDDNKLRMMAYNIPELLVRPVTVPGSRIARDMVTDSPSRPEWVERLDTPLPQGTP
ncbi:MAG: PD40 domain-containing protein [Thermoguttaceae bacterium]|nr:PD40 domain-containing protein [Thermoguttaceae bacterium]